MYAIFSHRFTFLFFFLALPLVSSPYARLLGFFLILLEAPFCCQFLEITDKVSKWSEARPAWQKALIYLM